MTLDEMAARARAAAERAEKATPGPWERDGISHYGHQPRVHAPGRLVAVFGNAEDSAEAQSRWGNDAAFTAAARSDVPTLAAYVLALIERVRELEKNA